MNSLKYPLISVILFGILGVAFAGQITVHNNCLGGAGQTFVALHTNSPLIPIATCSAAYGASCTMSSDAISSGQYYDVTQYQVGCVVEGNGSVTFTGNDTTHGSICTSCGS